MKSVLILIAFLSFFLAAHAQQPPPKNPKDPDSVALDRDSTALIDPPIKISKPDPQQIFTAAEHEPEFPGGMGAFYKFIRKNLNQPKDESQGKVYLSFIVEKDGSITNIQVLRSLSAEANAEAIRVMMKCPKWNPGIQNGKPVRVKYTLPIEF
jgi:periplasmic protein TonB